MASDSAAWSRAQLYLVRGIAVAALGLIATAAYADEDTDALPTRLPEIVVTAQKLNQTLEQVPVSVGTLDGALMDQSGASGFPDLQGYLGNVTLNLSPTDGVFFISGLGPLSTNRSDGSSVGQECVSTCSSRRSPR